MTTPSTPHNMSSSVEPEVAPKEAPKFARPANRLMVDTSDVEESTACVMSEEDMETLDLYSGDYVLLLGKRRKSTLVQVVSSDSAQVGRVYINKLCRLNLRVKLSDIITVKKPDPVAPNLRRVEILPIADTVEGLSGNLHDMFLVPYFSTFLKPVHEGDIFSVNRANTTVDFQVVKCEPEMYGIVNQETELFSTGEPVDREDAEGADEVGYDDIGGCSEALAKLREIVELPLRHPILFTSIGVKPPRGVLMYGPPGCGKTMIARAVAYETGSFFMTINGPEIMSKMQGGAEQNIREAFATCEERAPAILFIDEIDSIAPNRDKTHGEVERRVVSQLLTCMDGLKDRANLVVIAATNRPNSIEPALRRFGRFDRELDIGIPDRKGRLEILEIKTRTMKLAEDVDLSKLAHDTHGYVGADLAQLCTEAAMNCIREKFSILDLEDDDSIAVEILDKLCIEMRHFEEALQQTDPSALRETHVEMPEVHWDDVGGLEETKKELQEMVLYPVEHPEEYEYFNSSPSRGVLFYGPPGCGKTLLAKAVATECSANFISIKGPELLTKWFGESESNVRDIFDKARAAAPCILFFDELDSLASQRGANMGDSGVTDRVINQLLTEMDGVGTNKNVFIIGATNRPDQLDSAVVRPGRLDTLIYIPLPDAASRISILKANLKNTPIHPSVDLHAIARATDGYSGADLTEICQKAVRMAIRTAIDLFLREKKRREDSGDVPANMSDYDPVPFVLEEHFQFALRDSRKSVKPQDIMVYEDFAFRMKQAAGITGGQVRGPGTSNSGAGRPLGGSSNAAPVPANPPANQFQQSAEEEDADMYD